MYNDIKYMFAFQKLETYQQSKEFVKEVYSLINTFPDTERFALCNQIRRAAVSIPSNIAEGVSRISDKEKGHFIEISYGSLMEVLCQMEISADLGYIKADQFKEIEVKTERLSKLLVSLRHKYLTRNL